MKNKKSFLSKWFGHAVRGRLRRLRLLPDVWRLRGQIKDCGGDFQSHGITASILLPSRKRREMLIRALKNIAKTAGEYHQQVEVLVRLDDDDAESIAAQDEFHAAAGNVSLKIIVGPRGEGYLSFERFINELSAAARGDFLLLHNDDAEFTSDNWPPHLAKWRNRLVVLMPTIPGQNWNIFPAMHRKIFEILGHYSQDTHCDSWINAVAHKVSIADAEPQVVVNHFRDSEVDDATFQETSAAYATSIPRFEKKAHLIREDAAHLAAHILRHGTSLKIK